MKKVLTIIGGIVVVIILFFVILFVFTSLTSKKLECKSSEGNITIMYSDKTITGYTANGSKFNLTGTAVTSDTYANSYSSLVGKYLPAENSVPVHEFFYAFSTAFSTMKLMTFSNRNVFCRFSLPAYSSKLMPL